MRNCNYNTLENNAAHSNNQHGILLDNSNSNNLSNNTANSNDGVGILFNESRYNQLTNNTISNNGKNGICFRRSPYNTLKSNRISKNIFFNIHVKDTVTLEEWNNTIDDSNTANGLPVYYFYKKSDLVIDSYATNKIAIIGCINVTLRNITFRGGDPVAIVFTNDSLIENCTITNNDAAGFVLFYSHNNSMANNTASQNLIGFSIGGSTHNRIRGNIFTENVEYGIELRNCTDNRIFNNYFDNPTNVYDDGTNIWNISKTAGTNVVGGRWLGGNYWSDYTGQDLDGDGIGDTLLPYNSSGELLNGGDWLPLVAVPPLFDTGEGKYPSISGTFTGTIIPSQNLTVSTLYTYNCEGTAGHTKSIELYENTTLLASGVWSGYQGDWHNITLVPELTLFKDHEYQYVITTGSYPQIIHELSLNATGGTISCTRFTDVNGKTYTDWIPAIRLFS